MNDLVALIVGIERYDQPGWDVAGPGANAIAVANWLLDIKTPPNNVHLFLAPGPGLDDAIAGLEVAGVRVCRQGDFTTIDTFVREELGGERPANSRLLVYWSGHGFSEDDGTRVFICSDFKHEGLNNRVYDGSGLRHRLHRSSRYQCFREQLFLADVCAVHSNLIFDLPKSAAGSPMVAARQVAFFATPEGGYAHGDEGLGVFTRIALDVLGGFHGWPHLDGFSAKMEAAFERVGETPFRCDCFSDRTEVRNRLVGAVARDADSDLFRSVWSLLSALPVDNSVYWPHYRCTASSLYIPLPRVAPGLSDMIRVLASLSDPAVTGQMPYGLIEFLVRLSAEPPLTEPIADWLKARPDTQEHHQANARKKIDGEQREKILFVELQNDDTQGDIKHCKWYLRTRHLDPIHEIPAGVALRDEAVVGWNDFVQRFPSVVTALHEAHPISEIHFAVNAALFDLPFHRIAIGGDRLLGEAFVVLVRFLERLRDKTRTRHCWCAHAAALRGVRPDSIELLPLPGPGSAPADALGFCYTRFTVPRAPSSAQKLTLRKWLLAGFPYLVWSHEPPPDEDWNALGERYAKWLQQLDQLDAFPGAFTDRRLHDQPAAQQATLLWDDPACNPFDIQEH